LRFSLNFFTSSYMAFGAHASTCVCFRVLSVVIHLQLEKALSPQHRNSLAQGNFASDEKPFLSLSLARVKLNCKTAKNCKFSFSFSDEIAKLFHSIRQSIFEVFVGFVVDILRRINYESKADEEEDDESLGFGWCTCSISWLVGSSRARHSLTDPRVSQAKSCSVHRRREEEEI
jgi:hypothetical protein